MRSFDRCCAQCDLDATRSASRWDVIFAIEARSLQSLRGLVAVCAKGGTRNVNLYFF